MLCACISCKVCVITVHSSLRPLIQSGATPLYIASQQRHSDVVNILIRNGARVNMAKKVRKLLSVRTALSLIQVEWASLVYTTRQTGLCHITNNILGERCGVTPLTVADVSHPLCVSHVLLCWDCKRNVTQHSFMHVHCGLCLSRRYGFGTSFSRQWQCISWSWKKRRHWLQRTSILQGQPLNLYCVCPYSMQTFNMCDKCCFYMFLFQGR